MIYSPLHVLRAEPVLSTSSEGYTYCSLEIFNLEVGEELALFCAMSVTLSSQFAWFSEISSAWPSWQSCDIYTNR